MADVLDNILSQLNKIGETVVDKSGFYFKKAVDKGEELSKIGRIQLDIEKTRREIKSVYTRLGQLAFDENQEDRISALADHPAFTEHISSIRNLQSHITEKEQEKEAAKAQNNPDPVVTEDIE